MPRNIYRDLEPEGVLARKLKEHDRLLQELKSMLLVVGSYTTAGRPAAGTAGRIILNTTTSKLNIDTGTAWVHADGTAA